LIGDLRQIGGWRDALGDIDSVIHLAACAVGDLAEQFAGTVVATENLLSCLQPGRLRRFVHVSSFSVYDYTSMTAGTVLNEQSPTEAHPQHRDAYTWTKLLQEEMVADYCASAGVPLCVLRPGAIYGPGKDWAYAAALRLGRFEVVPAPRAQFRLTYVENCADAIVLALESPNAGGAVFNVVDDNLPTHAGYRRLSRAAGAPVGWTIYVPWWLLASTGWMIQTINRRLLGGRARLPEILEYRRQQAHWKPLNYDNALIKHQLGWRPQVTLNEGVQRTVRGQV
jgi:nucleoside-diphosphate-sugar epimerase